MTIDDLPTPQKRALALVTLMLRMRGGRDGEGLFEGVARYAVLKSRIEMAAERSVTVEGFWALCGRMLRWDIGPMRFDDAVLPLIAARDDDHETLRALAERAEPLVMRARQIAKRERDAAKNLHAPLPDDVPYEDPLAVLDRIADAPPAPKGATSTETLL